MGNGSVIRPGEVQRMTAGTGVTHSEANSSEAEQVHLLQIWILPGTGGLKPGYEQKTFTDDEKRNRLRLVASADGLDGSVIINQDASVYASVLDAGHEVIHQLAPNRGAWVQVARGKIAINGNDLNQGDGTAISDEPAIAIVASEPAELLLFDLA
jgi:redox-sensitive bicupin YhaK (pirin superfamily)